MLLYLFLAVLINCAACSGQQLTQTVYGFLDFTTTIGNTVMVFSPQSSKLNDQIIINTTTPNNIIETRPYSQENEASKSGIKPTPLVASSLQDKPSTDSKDLNKQVSLLNTPVKTLEFPEYALLSRQPAEFAEETYRVVNLKSHADTERQRPFQSKRDNNNNHSSGLLPRKKESLPKIGVTETLTAKPLTKAERRSKTRQSSSVRILKTLASSIQPSRLPLELASQQSVVTKTSQKTKSGEKRKTSRNKGKRRHKTTQASNLQITPSTVDTNSRRTYRTKTSQQINENTTVLSQNPLKLNRRPGRWQYKSSPKPKVNIRKNSSNNTPNTAVIDPLLNYTILDSSDKNLIQKAANNLGRDLDALGSQNSYIPDSDEIKPLNFVQTLNVDISTPSNFDDTYYEIATIKSPFIFQAGLVKKTRFLTVTSTIERTIKNDHIDEYHEDDGPLTENILASSTQMKEPLLDGSISTLKVIHITDGLETPELETITESFSITQTKLRTQILPIVFDQKNETIQITLVQTYDYTSLVTVTQTISPLKDNFIPSKDFKDFEGILDEAGSEINLDLEFGDEGNFGQSDVKQSSNNKKENKILPNSTNIEAQSQLFNTKQINNLDVPTLGQSQSVITTTRPIITHETVWESYIVPLARGTDSILRTLSKSVGVIEKTDYTTEVSTVLLPMSQYPQYSINPYFNPLLGLPQQQLVTSSSVFSTFITETSSKVLKLTFGARTAYTTIFSTSVVPTAVTQLITATLPIQNSGSFPNYYSPPFPPFAYVG